MKNDLGLVHVLTGDGVGKTTSSLGLAFRAAGHGLKVLFVQFLKGGDYSGEFLAAKKFPNLEMKQFGKPCTYLDKRRDDPKFECGPCRDCFLNDEDALKFCKEAFDFSQKAVKSGKYDLIVLDEIIVAVNYKFINLKQVLDLIKNKNPKTELILTGRNAPEELMKIADYATDIKKIKHPIDKGIFGRWGIEF